MHDVGWADVAPTPRVWLCPGGWGSLRGWAHCHLGGGAPSPMGRAARDFAGRGWGGLPVSTQPSPSLQDCTYSILPSSDPHVPSAHCHLLCSTCLSHRPTLGIRANRPAPQTLASSLTFYFSFCTAKYSFQVCLLTEVTFLVLLTCSFFLIYFATPPGSYSPRPHPPSSHPSEPLFFFF